MMTDPAAERAADEERLYDCMTGLDTQFLIDLLEDPEANPTAVHVARLVLRERSQPTDWKD